MRCYENKKKIPSQKTLWEFWQESSQSNQIETTGKSWKALSCVKQYGLLCLPHLVKGCYNNYFSTRLSWSVSSVKRSGSAEVGQVSPVETKKKKNSKDSLQTPEKTIKHREKLCFQQEFVPDVVFFHKKVFLNHTLLHWKVHSQHLCTESLMFPHNPCK